MKFPELFLCMGLRQKFNVVTIIELLHQLGAHVRLDLIGQQLPITLDRLCRDAFFADLIGSRIVVSGPKRHLNAAAAQAIGLTLHELATNAGKYSAFSTDAGRVEVSWQSEGDVFTMSWTARDGPPVQAADHRGFGTTVIDSMVKRVVVGEVQLNYASSGLEWHLTCPAANALEGTAMVEFKRRYAEVKGRT